MIELKIEYNIIMLIQFVQHILDVLSIRSSNFDTHIALK